MAPVPAQSAPAQQPLPLQLETIPGNHPSAGGSGGPLPAPVQSVPAGAPSQPGSSTAESQGQTPSAQPASPQRPRPLSAPQPVEMDPPAAPDLFLPTPAPPAPQLPVAPRPTPQSQPVPSPQNGNAAPTPVPLNPETATPVEPSVSAVPMPEQAMTLKTAKKDTSVLSTGGSLCGVVRSKNLSSTDFLWGAIGLHWVCNPMPPPLGDGAELMALCTNVSDCLGFF